MRLFIKGFCFLLFLAGVLTVYSQEWNAWRGPNHDGKSVDVDLLEIWPKEGPELLWETDGVGEGYSNLVFSDTQIFTEGDEGDDTYLYFLDRANGKIVRKVKVGSGGDIGGYRGPRSTPCTDGLFVYTLNQKGVLTCVEIATGKIVWTKHYQDDFQGKMMKSQHLNLDWGVSESPLIDDNRLICSPGGEKGTFVALDKRTGDLIWRTTAITDGSTYCSVQPVVIDKVRQYLVVSHNAVAGIDPKNGSLLWKAEFPGITAVANDPVYNDGIVFISSGYNVGAYAWNVCKNGDKFVVQSLFHERKADNKHHGMILVGDFVYYASDRGSFMCVELKTGKIQWDYREMRGKTAITFADGKLILRKENSGEIILVDPTPKQYRELARFQQPHRSKKNAWTYPVVVDKKLYIRDQNKIFCFDLAQKK